MIDVVPLEVAAEATAANVGRLRRVLRRWLDGVLGDDLAVENLTLAASEALENAVDHAFSHRSRPGTMTVRAEVDDVVGDGRLVVVVVGDDGHWQPHTEPGYRGRGLALIGELADSHGLRTGETGTTVTLRHALS